MKNYILANPPLIEQNDPKRKKDPSDSDGRNFTPDTQPEKDLKPHERAAKNAGYDVSVKGTSGPALPDPTDPKTWAPFVADKLGKTVDEIGDPSNWTEEKMVEYLRIALDSLKELDNTAYNLFLGNLATTMADDLDTGLQTAFEDLLSNDEEELKADLDTAEDLKKRFGPMTPEERKEMEELEKKLSQQRRTGKAPPETPGVKGGDERDDSKMIDIERFIDPGFELGDLGDWDALWGEMKKQFPQNTGEPNEAYAIRIFGWAFMQLLDGAIGLDFTEIGQFVTYMSEGEYEKAWNEIAPNLEALTDQAIAFASKAIEEIEVEGKYPATAVRRSKDKELSEAYITAATTVVSLLVITKLLPAAGKHFAKKRALQNLVRLGKIAKLKPDELLELAKGKLDGPLENWFKGEAAFKDALDKAARAEGWTGTVWGDKTMGALERGKVYFSAGSESVARTLLGGPLLYDTMGAYYDNIIQSEMGIEVAKKLLLELKEATGYEYENIDEAKKGLQVIIDRDTNRKNELYSITKEGSAYNDENLLKLKVGEKNVKPRITSIYNSAPAGMSLRTDAEQAHKAVAALANNPEDKAARTTLMQFLLDYKQITNNREFRPRIMADLIIKHGWPTPKNIENHIKEAKKLEDRVKSFKGVLDNLDKQINTIWAEKIKLAKNATINMMRKLLPLYEDSFAGAVTNMQEFADIAKTDSGLNKLFRNFEDRLRVGRGSLDLLKIFVKKAADVTEFGYGVAAKIAAGAKKVKDTFTKPIGKILKTIFLENKKDTSKTKYYLLTEESKRQSNENFEVAIQKLMDEVGKEIDSKINQKENEIDSQIATAEADVTASMDGLYDMIKATARRALADDIETMFGAAMSGGSERTQTPASEEDLQERKYTVSKQDLIDVITEHLQDQIALVEVDKDQLINYITEEAYKTINRKK